LPLLQTAVPWAGTGQAFPQVPQLAGSLSGLTQLEPHATNGSTQAKVHSELMHTAVPSGGAVHTAPHPRQFWGSLLRVLHLPPQTVSPSRQMTGPPSVLDIVSIPGRTQMPVAASQT
jgi:hypothetical protein